MRTLLLGLAISTLLGIGGGCRGTSGWSPRWDWWRGSSTANHDAAHQAALSQAAAPVLPSTAAFAASTEGSGVVPTSLSQSQQGPGGIAPAYPSTAQGYPATAAYQSPPAPGMGNPATAGGAALATSPGGNRSAMPQRGPYDLNGYQAVSSPSNASYPATAAPSPGLPAVAGDSPNGPSHGYPAAEPPTPAGRYASGSRYDAPSATDSRPGGNAMDRYGDRSNPLTSGQYAGSAPAQNYPMTSGPQQNPGGAEYQPAASSSPAYPTTAASNGGYPVAGQTMPGAPVAGNGSAYPAPGSYSASPSGYRPAGTSSYAPSAARPEAPPPGGWPAETDPIRQAGGPVDSYPVYPSTVTR